MRKLHLLILAAAAVLLPCTLMGSVPAEQFLVHRRLRKAGLVVAGALSAPVVDKVENSGTRYTWTIKVEKVLHGILKAKTVTVTHLDTGLSPGPAIPKKPMKAAFVLGKDGKNYRPGHFFWHMDADAAAGALALLKQKKDPRKALLSLFASDKPGSHTAALDWVIDKGPHEAEMALQVYLAFADKDEKLSRHPLVSKLYSFGDEYSEGGLIIRTLFRAVREYRIRKQGLTVEKKNVSYAEWCSWQRLDMIKNFALAESASKKKLDSIRETVKLLTDEKQDTRQQAEKKMTEYAKDFPLECVLLMREALKSIRDRETAKRLNKIIRSMGETPDRDVRPLRKSIPVLLFLLDDNEQPVRLLALERLKTLTGKNVDFDTSQEDRTKRLKAIRKLTALATQKR